MQYSEIEVTNIRPYAGSTTLKAYATVRVGDIIVHGVKILQNDSNELWAAFPSIEKNGKFFDVVEVDSRSRDRQIKTEIIKQYRQLAGTVNGAFTDAAPVSPFDHPAEESQS
ncbi:MAG: septation protein SpoVG family protein [Syntrophales bacterium]